MTGSGDLPILYHKKNVKSLEERPLFKYHRISYKEWMMEIKGPVYTILPSLAKHKPELPVPTSRNILYPVAPAASLADPPEIIDCSEIQAPKAPPPYNRESTSSIDIDRSTRTKGRYIDLWI